VEQHGLLRLEVTEERTRRDIGGRRDVVDGRCRKAVLEKQLKRRVDDRLARAIDVFLSQ
jgi:hypothetical protein